VLEVALVDAIVEVVFVLWLDMAGGLCNCEIVARCVCNIGSTCSWERWSEEQSPFQAGYGRSYTHSPNLLTGPKPILRLLVNLVLPPALHSIEVVQLKACTQED
jgi:hypothetical protein